MKKTVNMLFSFLAVSTLAVAAPETTTSTKTETVKDHPKPVMMNGTVVSVDNVTKTVTITETVKTDGKETPREVKLTWNEATRLMWQGDTKMAATLTDIKPGVVVTYYGTETNPNMLHEIVIARPTETKTTIETKTETKSDGGTRK